MILPNKSENRIKNLYFKIKNSFDHISNDFIQFCRRVLRFIALPYCYFNLVNWDECPKTRTEVISDLLYIFFVLKYYPDNYSPCRLWEKKRYQWSEYYGSIYDPYQRKQLRKEVQKKKYEILFEDKHVCYQLCKAAKFPLPKQYSSIDINTDYHEYIKSLLKNAPNEKLIIKPIGGKGGNNIVIAYKKGTNIIVQDKGNTLSLKRFKLLERSVIQSYISQHELMSQISPSINTIRIVTLLDKNNTVILLGAYMRFGINDAYVDNVSSGGISVGIDIDKGKFKECAYDSKGKLYFFHPTSRFVFDGTNIPNWSKVIELAKQIQTTFNYYKLIGSDIAITPKGPIVIEINALPDMVALEQRYGPILENKAVKKAFMEYNLLINTKSKKDIFLTKSIVED